MGNRNILRRLHIGASIAAFTLIFLFLVSSLWVEFSGGPQQIAFLKQRIAYALLLLVPAIALAGITGFSMAGKPPKGVAAAKALRMKLIAANGLLLLVPMALFLACYSSSLILDNVFWTVQSLEYLAGFTNIVLIGLNFRDGLKMTRGRRRRVSA